MEAFVPNRSQTLMPCSRRACTFHANLPVKSTREERSARGGSEEGMWVGELGIQGSFSEMFLVFKCAVWPVNNSRAIKVSNASKEIAQQVLAKLNFFRRFEALFIEMEHFFKLVIKLCCSWLQFLSQFLRYGKVLTIMLTIAFTAIYLRLRCSLLESELKTMSI